jgi:uncharacterized protein YutE (UPF0331/DUF86 family)
MDDVLLNKAAIIERCLRRVKSEYAACPELDNYTHIDAIILNLERASQAAIDMAAHIVSKEHLGIPQSSADMFGLLHKAGITDKTLTKSLKGMVGFRNIAVHEYQSLNLDILRYVIEDGYKDLVVFCEKLGIRIVVG